MNKADEKKMLYAIQWQDSDWKWLAEIAQSVGLSRSDFVRKAALAAATAAANGMTPYFVKSPSGTTQNTRIGIFGDSVTENGNACDRRLRRGEAKGADDEGEKKSPKP